MQDNWRFYFIKLLRFGIVNVNIYILHCTTDKWANEEIYYNYKAHVSCT